MYYYILEPAKTGAERKIHDKIKQLTIEAGISGEMVIPSPARTVDELIDMGIRRQYSTFVAIGSDPFINQTLSSLLNQTDERMAFGYVPVDFKNSHLLSLTNINTIEDSILALRFRKLKSVPVGIIAPNKYFISPLYIHTKQPFKGEIVFSNLYAEFQATHLEVSPDLEISMIDESLAGHPAVAYMKSLFNVETKNLSYTKLKNDRIELKTHPSLPIYLDSLLIAKTPSKIYVQPSCLQLIVNRDKISLVGKEKNTLETEN